MTVYNIMYSSCLNYLDPSHVCSMYTYNIINYNIMLYALRIYTYRVIHQEYAHPYFLFM